MHLCYLCLNSLCSEVLWRILWFTAIAVSPSRLPLRLQEALIYSNKLQRDESLPLRSLYHLSFIAWLPASIPLSCSIPAFFPLSNLLIAIPAISVCSLCSFSLLPTHSGVAAAVQPCQDQVELRSWQRLRCLASVADTRLKALKLGFKTSKVEGWRDRWKEGCWEQGRVGKEGW